MRHWSVADFTAAFTLLGRMAALAEAADHHPDIAFGHGQVSVTPSTHDAGGLTNKDVALAKRFDQTTGS